MSDTVSPEAFQELQQQMKDMQTSFANSQKENAALKQLVSQKEPAPENVLPKLPKQVFKVDGVSYRFKVRRFSIPMQPGQSAATKVTAVDALTDQKLLELIVRVASGVIEEVTDETED